MRTRNAEWWTWVAITAAVLVPGAFAGVSWLLRDADARELVDAVRRSEDLRFQLVRAKSVPEPAEPAAARRWQLFEQTDAAGIVQTIQDAAEDAGVVLDQVAAAAAAESGKQSVRVIGRGRPNAVCTFLADLEQSERLLVVESGRIEPASPGAIGFELGVAAYQRGGGQ